MNNAIHTFKESRINKRNAHLGLYRDVSASHKCPVDERDPVSRQILTHQWIWHRSVTEASPRATPTLLWSDRRRSRRHSQIIAQLGSYH